MNNLLSITHVSTCGWCCLLRNYTISNSYDRNFINDDRSSARSYLVTNLNEYTRASIIKFLHATIVSNGLACRNASKPFGIGQTAGASLWQEIWWGSDRKQKKYVFTHEQSSRSDKGSPLASLSCSSPQENALVCSRPLIHRLLPRLAADRSSNLSRVAWFSLGNRCSPIHEKNCR